MADTTEQFAGSKIGHSGVIAPGGEVTGIGAAIVRWVRLTVHGAERVQLDCELAVKEKLCFPVRSDERDARICPTLCRSRRTVT